MYLLSGHADWVISVGFSADGSKVVSGSQDNTVKIWNADSGEVIQTLSGEIDKDMYVSQVQYIVYSIVGVW
jgi:WD40 repeat protein